MMKLNKKLNQLFAVLILIAMVFTTNGMYTLANTKNITNVIEEQKEPLYKNNNANIVNETETIDEDTELNEENESSIIESRNEESTDDEVVDEYVETETNDSDNEENVNISTDSEIDEEDVADEEIEETSYSEEPEEDRQEEIEEKEEVDEEDVEENEEDTTEEIDEAEEDVEETTVIDEEIVSLDDEDVVSLDDEEQEETSDEAEEEISLDETEGETSSGEIEEETTLDEAESETSLDETESETSLEETEEETTQAENQDEVSLDETVSETTVENNEQEESLPNNQLVINETNDFAVCNATASIINDESGDEEDGNSLLGVTQPTINKVLELDFGEGPGPSYTNFSSYVSSSGLKSKGNNKYTVGESHSSGTLLTSIFPSAPRDAEGHVMLPAFNNVATIWAGHTFKGWKNEYGGDESYFQNAIQWEDPKDSSGKSIPTKYVATWEDSTSFKVSITKKYLRYGAAASDRQMIPTQTVSNLSPGAEMSISPIDITGYKIRTKGQEAVINGTTYTNSNVFKNVRFDGTLADTSIPMTFDGNNVLYGAVPNHDITIIYYYEPDINTSKSITIKYLNYDTSMPVKEAEVYTKAPETDLDYSPSTTIPNYNYYSATLQVLGTPSVERGIYTLGTYPLSGQILTPNAAGRFYAKMPNMGLVLTYYYKKNPIMYSNVTCIYKFEGKPDITQTLSVQVDLTTQSTFPLSRSGFPTATEMKGYGVPSVNVSGVGVEIKSFNNTIGSSDIGKINFIVKDDASNKTITINFANDYTRTEYWQKVAINWNSDGNVVVAPGAKGIEERYVSIGSHSFNELIDGLTPTPNTNYVFDGWYKGVSVGVGKENDTKITPSTSITIAADGGTGINKVVGHKFIIYAEFVKDPNKFATVNFAVDPDSTSHGVITSLPTSWELTRPNASTPFSWSSIPAFPTVTCNARYKLAGWKYTIGTNTYTKTEAEIRSSVTIERILNFNAVIVEKEFDDNLLHMPIIKLNSQNDGQAKAIVYGANDKRKYLLTDKDGKVLEVKNAAGLTNGFATTLKPGVFYKSYEIKDDVTISAGANVSTITASKRSDPTELHVPAVKNYSVTGNAVTGFNINLTKATGMNYALLSRDFSTVVKGFNATNFTGLPSADAYVVVASPNAGDNPLSAHIISQGVTVNTELHNVTNREYRLIIDSETGGASAIGTPIAETIGTKKVYYVTAGTEVAISGLIGGRWTIVSNNVPSLNETSSVQTFTMPSEDVYLTSTVPNYSYSQVTLDIINNTNHTIGIRDKWKLLKEFEDNDLLTPSTGLIPIIGGADYDGLEVKYYIIFDKIGKNIQSGKFTYVIKMRLAAIVDGKVTKWSNANAHNIDVIYDIPNEYLGNVEYKRYLTGSTINLPCDYSTADYAEVSSTNAIMKGDGTSELSISCTKTHILKLILDNEVLPSDVTYSQDFNVIDGEPISSKISQVTNGQVYDIVHTNPLTNARYLYDVNSSYISQYNTVVYNCTGLYNDNTLLPDGVDTPVISNITYNLKFVKDEEREVKKALLKNKIAEAEAELATERGQVPTNLVNITNILEGNVPTVTTPNTGAKHIMDFHIDYTSDEIQLAIDAIEDVIVNMDPIPPVTVYIDANGGVASVSEVVGHVGETWVALASVSIAYEDHVLVCWNTDINGEGDIWDSNTDVATSQNLITIYAQWLYVPPIPIPVPDPEPVIRYKSGGGGGGGVSTKRRVDLSLTPQPIGPVFMPKVDIPLTNTNDTSKAAVFLTNDVDGKLFQDITDTLNTSLYFVKNDKTVLTDTWAVITYRDGDATNSQLANGTYYFGKDGKAASGFHIDKNQVYYLNHDNNYKFGQLKTGWIYDGDAKKWYYGDEQSGALKTNYQVIQNSMYYFNPNATYDANGNIDINTFNFGDGYASLQIGGKTPDGYAVTQQGVVVGCVRDDDEVKSTGAPDTSTVAYNNTVVIGPMLPEDQRPKKKEVEMVVAKPPKTMPSQVIISESAKDDGTNANRVSIEETPIVVETPETIETNEVKSSVIISGTAKVSNNETTNLPIAVEENIGNNEGKSNVIVTEIDKVTNKETKKVPIEGILENTTNTQEPQSAAIINNNTMIPDTTVNKTASAVSNTGINENTNLVANIAANNAANAMLSINANDIVVKSTNAKTTTKKAENKKVEIAEEEIISLD